jgi:hypothetical protein
MTLNQAIAQANGVGISLSNGTITGACSVLSDTFSTRSQKESASDTLVWCNDNITLGTSDEWAFFDAVDIISKTVNPNGPKPTRPA